MTAKNGVNLMDPRPKYKPIGKTGVSSEGHNDTFGNTGNGKPRGISPTTGIISAPFFQNVHKIVQAMITWKMKRYININCVISIWFFTLYYISYIIQPI